MTTTTREKLQKEHFFIRSRTEIVEWLAKEVWTLDENALVAFIETIEKEAEERWIQQGREEVRNEIDLWVGAVHPNSEELDAFISSL